MGRIVNCVVCDEIRQEITNKFILIGVYVKDIVVPEFPTHTAISIWLQYRPDRIGDHDIFVRVNGPTDEEGKLAPFVGMRARAVVDKIEDRSEERRVGKEC